MPFPKLPRDQQWGADVRRAYDTVKATYRAATAVAQREESESIRLKIWAGNLDGHSRLINALEQSDLPLDWITRVRHVMSTLSDQLRAAAAAAEGM